MTVRNPLNRAHNFALLIFSILFLIVSMTVFYRTDLVDFLAFIGAARKTLLLQSPYEAYPTTFGASVFQSLPWVSWLFIPFILISEKYSWSSFILINLVVLLIIVLLIIKTFRIKFTPLESIFIYSCTTAISFYCLNFGQVTIFQMGFLTLILFFLKQRKFLFAGFLMPFILLKPHLMLWLLIILCARNRGKFLVSSIISVILFSSFALIIDYRWPIEFIRTIVAGRAESTMESWKYLTLPGVLFLQPSYGFLVTPLAIPLFVWLHNKTKYLSLPTKMVILLPFSLAASPYAFAYDLPLLIPFLVYWSREWSDWKVLFWIIISMISIFNYFSSLAYLAVLIACILAIEMILSPERLKKPGNVRKFPHP